jgi:DeoR/GlpR family transcriptional regulator of sugar metabolism
MKATRRQQIHELLQAKPFVSLKELAEMFPDVTTMTLRRDIEHFEKQGELIKVRNGARSMKFITATADENYRRREKENEASKRTIASAALPYLESGKCIFLDSGSTIMQLAALMPDEVMNIVTPGPNVSLKLIEKQNPIVTLIGGILNRDSISVTGDISIEALKAIDIDTAFIVPSGYSEKNGFSCGNYSECELKGYVVKNAKKVIMLIDSSKFEKDFPYSFCKMSDIDVLVTDADFKKYMENAENHGVKIVSTGTAVYKGHISKCIPVEI